MQPGFSPNTTTLREDGSRLVVSTTTTLTGLLARSPTPSSTRRRRTGTFFTYGPVHRSSPTCRRSSIGVPGVQVQLKTGVFDGQTLRYVVYMSSPARRTGTAWSSSWLSASRDDCRRRQRHPLPAAGHEQPVPKLGVQGGVAAADISWATRPRRTHRGELATCMHA